VFWPPVSHKWQPRETSWAWHFGWLLTRGSIVLYCFCFVLYFLFFLILDWETSLCLPDQVVFIWTQNGTKSCFGFNNVTYWTVWFEPRSRIIIRWIVVVWLSVVLRGTVCGDIDWRYHNITRSSINQDNNQSLITSTDDSQFTWLWWCLPLRLSNRQSMSPQAVLLRAALIRTIIIPRLMMWLIEFSSWQGVVFPCHPVSL